jgi:phosphatidylinositol-3-phosphatase
MSLLGTRGYALNLLFGLMQIMDACSGSGDSRSGPTVTIAVAPRITSQPANIAVAVGHSASFSVTAVGTAPLSYEWEKGGTAISGATASSYSTGVTTISDNGEVFSVTVSNTAGAITSQSAKLTVNVVPVAPSITIQPANVAVSAGQSTSFSVVAVGTAPRSYQWLRNGAIISGATASSYSTGAITASDNGQAFAVTVSNSAGAVTSNTAVLTVNTAAVPFGHVVIVMEENADYSTVVGASATMPYLNSLISSYGLATEYYANAHPSIGNYEMVVTGQVLTNDDSQTPASFPISVDNIVRELSANGKSWKAYAEDLPTPGYIGGDTGNYAVRHVPLAYLTDVQDSATGRQGLVPFSQFPADLASGQLPNFSFITPNLCHDAHNCSLSVADTWLKANIAPLLTTPFKDDGLLIITFDESADDDTHGGGRIAAIFVSPAFSKQGYKSTTLYQHQSTLRLMLQGLGVNSLPGASATAPTMWEFFTFPAP